MVYPGLNMVCKRGKYSKLRIHHMFSSTTKTRMEKNPTTKPTIPPYRESGTWICLKKGQQVLQFTHGTLYSGMPVP